MKVTAFTLTTDFLITEIADGNLDFKYPINRADFEQWLQAQGEGDIDKYYAANAEINDSAIQADVKRFIQSARSEMLAYDMHYAKAHLRDAKYNDETNEVFERRLDTFITAMSELAQYTMA